MRTIEQLHATAEAPGPGAAGVPEAGPGSRSDRGERMITKYSNWESWEKAYDRLGFERVMGMSPGGAAGRLGISRQAVYDLVRRDKLELVKVKKKNQVRYSEIYITEESLKREIEIREKKRLDN